ncbi:hypothetical protein AVEN_14149-1 [Araneus ventricosus]|uniref:DDE Tnp4 domain-containing protein n=1 Tax=Araneus ventricosus TaxID=182803 RepID=A0A4Y2FYX5_ARAVE|nr:hypothetical protein AVEN_14149-1 [Araneus ventricosus]
METEEELLYFAAYFVYLRTRKPKKKWCKQWLLNRSRYSHTNLFKDLSLEPADWRNYLRMDQKTYLQLLDVVTPLIKKKDTFMRESITPNERLAATLRFLATGMNYEQLKFPTLISLQRLGVIIPETCIAILMCLKDYMKMPESQSEWKCIAQGFENIWNFPHCLGAVDGKHVRITPPPRSGSYFWNYKQFNSIVLMACANSNYEFIWCEVGTNGRISDGGAIKNTIFYEKLVSGGLNIPPPETVGGSMFELPYVFVGDEAFALRPDFMKPYAQKLLNTEKRIFNYRLSRARRIVENAFGILANRFRIFHTSINIALPKIEIVVLTCCVLHNYLRKNSPGYVTEEEMNEPNFETTLTALSPDDHRNASNSAKLVRENFSDYFNGEGEVYWQNEVVFS